MSWPRGLLTASALIAVAAFAYLVSNALSRQGAARPGAALVTRPRLAGTPPRAAHLGDVSLSGVRGYAPERPADSAVDAAAGYLGLVDQVPPSPDAMARLREMTLAPLRGDAVRAETATAVLARRLTVAGSGFARGWPLGWRIITHTSTTARVAIWTMGTVASPTEVIAPDWSTTVCVLRWSAGTWKVASAHTSPGPTPPSRGANRGAVTSFARSASGFRSFIDAP